ncbi:Bug family tripartite tricarboxylate transporter substrate binding protein [Paracraurococcus ruber]|uniref:ABC transporter substrate-binding protein n=1 Tax=Paracraurococcus ruber TaxID=77675 RepID=A0ABS1CRU3_9PROT|nr:tripartite tricarboxylate transporter substrate binding protein [Paracraurococcus ruber]MBK1657099.1 ABC transporter substrate-binding protein [Paracraurococcus ruber]TDG33398.1 tripartite tricarboxylate transporter substrate binding protein [Paracraurococcus ruber]
MTLSRRAALAAALATLPPAARAQWAPARPLRWIVGYPPGGGTDVLARLLANGMGEKLGQPVVVENRPGAATNIGAEAAARAEPDGHTVFTAGNETLVFNPALYRNLSFNVDQDLRPLGLMARFHLVVAVRTAASVTSLPALLDRARSAPGTVDYGSPGIGSPHHLAMERLARDAGIRLNHVPYRGMAPVMNDLMAGTVEAAVLDLAAGGEALRSGRIRPLAVCSPAQHPTLPEVPTVAEAAGLQGFEAYAWQGLTAPFRTPDAAATRLAAALAATLGEAPVQARMREIGLEPLTGDAAAYRALIAADRAIYWPLIKALGLTLD